MIDSDSVLIFGDFRLFPGRRQLFDETGPVRIGSHAFDLLLALLERRDQIVEKETLKRLVWADTLLVEDHNLAVALSTLRRTLGDSSLSPRYIATVSGRGYRFIAPVDMQTPHRQAPATPTVSHNLQAPLTRLIGRAADMAETVRKLSEGRIVTLVGEGGVGKTRVALAVAERFVQQRSDGVWFVELAPIRDPALVATAIGAAIGLPTASQSDALFNHLADLHAMLVLDNCEHLLAATAALAEEILARCPQIRILATSREPLQIEGERRHRLAGLPVPSRTAPQSTADILGCAAVELLLDRMPETLDAFQPDETTTRALAEICQRLDGIPLAIELAAARVPGLGVAELASRLDQRFRILTQGRRTAPSRQQTLLATMEWSHDLLSPAEQVVLRRLSVFAGGYTLAAAEAIVPGGSLSGAAVANLMASLVDKSLIMSHASEGHARYELLETVRVFAADKLDHARETAQLARAHAHYYRGLFHDKYGRRPAPIDDAWLRTHKREIENVRVALDWAFGPAGDPEVGIGLASTTSRLWIWLGLESEATGRLMKALDFAGPSVPVAESARLHRAAAAFVRNAGNVALARRLIEVAIAHYREADDRLWLGHALITKAEILAFHGTATEAEAIAREGLALIDEDEPFLCGLGLMVLAHIAFADRRPAEAKAAMDKALLFYRRADCGSDEAVALTNLSDCLLSVGRLDDAVTCARAAVERFRQLNDKGYIGLAMVNLTAGLAAKGELDAALATATEAMPMVRNSPWLRHLLDHLALLHCLGGAEQIAAGLAGVADRLCAPQGGVREGTEARSYGRLMGMLSRRHSPETVRELMLEGAGWSRDQAIDAALSGELPGRPREPAVPVALTV
ncbi:MAG TPA: winged helix-turn-helix domain-containing protein [Aliidongia sp.]|uniref:ATP-binding protein n=1 Tax=Aliidongia sp. TaxID=1914230 RepID=UPI002DDCCCB4|nr:winged helix-turn-helix domain-containing protein [Aliidongia sp.]HEV2672936.1 winged helix-turn-helix domain-containing protein [Aliidongia sp.]